MKKVAGIAGILAPIVVASLLAVSDVQGGAALTPPTTKVNRAGVTATIVTDVTGGSFADGKGLTSIRVQKGSASEAVIFNSSYVASFVDQCIPSGFSLETGTANRFTGLMDGFVDEGDLNSLFAKFGTPSKAVITGQDYVTCTNQNGRQILSFMAVVQFAQ